MTTSTTSTTSNGHVAVRVRAPMRVAHGAIAALFAWSAALQLNDPDPLVWIALYAGATVLCAAAAARRLWWKPALLWAAVAALWALTLAPSGWAFIQRDASSTSFYMKTGDTQEEEARECGGLTLVAAWCTVIAWQGRRAVLHR